LAALVVLGCASWNAAIAGQSMAEQEAFSVERARSKPSASESGQRADGPGGPPRATGEAPPDVGSVSPGIGRASLGKLEDELARVDSEGPPVISGPRDLFELQGIDQSHFQWLTDGTPWQQNENETLLKVMYRLHRSFRPVQVDSWSLGEPQPAELARDPDAYRGEIFRLAGRVVSLEVLRPVREVARRFELNEYYRCEFLLGEEEHLAVLFAHTIPEAWKGHDSIDARAGAFAVFLKLAGDEPRKPVPVFVASRAAWYPPTRLGNLGFDYGLFDELRAGKTPQGEGPGPRPRKPRRLKDLRLTRRNRECFYQMLAAVGRTEPGALLAEANQRLQRAGEERFSVVPLFNRPLEQQGELVVLSGTARQVIPVRVSDADVVARFGIDRYYHIVLFTEDSRSPRGGPGRNPLVFCVRELPEGMPRGEGPGFGEHVTVAGFFFNRWAYRNRRRTDAAALREEWQLAPLLIGRDLLWHPRKQPAANPYLGAIAGGLFVLALVGVWLALWRYGRGDRQFHDRTIARKYALSSEASLDAIGLDTDEAPGFRGRQSTAHPGRQQAADSGSDPADQSPADRRDHSGPIGSSETTDGGDDDESM
jgi:hypothetical protein